MSMEGLYQEAGLRPWTGCNSSDPTNHVFEDSIRVTKIVKKIILLCMHCSIHYNSDTGDLRFE